MTFTKEQIEEWLGSSNTLEEAIDVIKEIANMEYTATQLKSDLIESEV